MFKNIERELKQMYSTSEFKIVEQNDNIEIFYNDKSLKDNEKFMDDVIDICEKYLTEDDLWRIAILYDYLDEIKNNKYLGMYEKSKYSYQQDRKRNNNRRNSIIVEKLNYESSKNMKFTSEANNKKSNNKDVSLFDRDIIKLILCDDFLDNTESNIHINNIRETKPEKMYYIQ